MAEPTTRQSNPKRTVVAINASGGALVLISASKFAKYVEITECPPEGTSDTYAPQGLIVTLPDDGYVAQFGLPPGLIWSIGDNSWRSKASVAAPIRTKSIIQKRLVIFVSSPEQHLTPIYADFKMMRTDYSDRSSSVFIRVHPW